MVLFYVGYNRSRTGEKQYGGRSRSGRKEMSCHLFLASLVNCLLRRWRWRRDVLWIIGHFDMTWGFPSSVVHFRVNLHSKYSGEHRLLACLDASPAAINSMPIVIKTDNMAAIYRTGLTFIVNRKFRSNELWIPMSGSRLLRSRWEAAIVRSLDRMSKAALTLMEQ